MYTVGHIFSLKYFTKMYTVGLQLNCMPKNPVILGTIKSVKTEQDAKLYILHINAGQGAREIVLS